MWSTKYEAQTDAAPAAVWAALRDLHSGIALGPASHRFELHGPFAVGTELSTTPRGQETVRSVIVELADERLYADRTEFNGLMLTFRHRLLPLTEGGTAVTHELVIEGDEADRLGPELGPQISADFPEAMATLLDAAAKR